jgi:hypothetical protein
MIREGYFNADNVFDDASEQHIELSGFSICEAVPASSFVPRAE